MDYKQLLTDEQQTQSAAADRFANQYQNRVRYVPGWKKWLAWDGKRWAPDFDRTVTERLAAESAKGLWTAVGAASAACSPQVGQLVKYATLSNRRSDIVASVDMARTNPILQIKCELLDASPYLFNCQNGTYDLKTMEFRGHKRGDGITQVASCKYDIDADCPLWIDTLDKIFGSDKELIEFLQRYAGYCLSGLVQHEFFVVFWGNGCNGKSTIWNTIAHIFGDYSTVLPDSTITVQKHAQHPTDIARLFRKRIASVTELDATARLSESTVKQLCSTDTITARRMYEDFWDFNPTHKIWLSTNHKPQIRGNDEGIWRRVKLVPFTRDLSAFKDETVKTRLLTESAGIFNWLLLGWSKYRQDGLHIPDSIVDATKEYREGQDHIGQFVSECCDTESSGVVTAKDLFQRYQIWGGTWSKTAFGKAMKQRFESDKPQSGEYRKQVIYRGIC